MKVCLSGRQTDEYCRKADELKIEYKDIGGLFDLVQKFPDKTFIIDCKKEDNINWKRIEQSNILAKKNLIVCVYSINHLRQAVTLGIRRYFGYPVSTFWELNSLLDFDMEYILLNVELFFQMDKVYKLMPKIRIIPNVAYTDNLPHKDGILGSWVRPEDLETVYGQYISAIEFGDCDLKKERAMYRIYIEEKAWLVNLDILITNLNYSALNKLLSEDFSKSRLNCGQRCLGGGACRVCQRAMGLAASVKELREYFDEVDKK